MELLQLRYFYESAKLGSFAKAAEKYNVPATSVAASVKRLERELGCALFDRTCNRAVLNQKGKQLLQTVSVMLEELEQAVRDLQPAVPDTRNIKMLVKTTRTKVTEAIISYKIKHPQVGFQTVFEFGDSDFAEYDIIIDDEKSIYPDYESFPLYTAQIRLRAAEDHPLCGKKLTIKELKDQAFVSVGEENSMTRILKDACMRAGFAPNIAIRSNDISCCERCVLAGVGIGFGRQFPNEPVAEGTQYLDVTDFHVRQTINCFYKKQSAYGNVKGFLEHLQAAAAVSGTEA